MAKKSKKASSSVEEAPADVKKNGKKNSKDSKNGKDEKQQTNAKGNAPVKNGRAIVTKTSSWTGKLPGSLLHEHCQKQKWNKVEYDMKKLPDGFIAVPQLSWENPKTKELIHIKFHPPKEIVKPQETPIEARHYAATYALHRIAFNKNLHMVLPTNHKNLWSDLEAERKRITAENEKRARLEYANDPFQALIEKRKEDDAKKKEREIKQASLEKVKKQTIVIGSSSGATLKSKVVSREKPSNSEKLTSSNPPLNSDYRLGKVNKVTFPRKVWENSILFDLDTEIAISIEDAIRNHIEWSEESSEGIDSIKRDVSYTSLLEKIGFRKTHIQESLKYTYTFNDSLEWLIFHLPEDDLPACFARDDSVSNVKLKITKDLNKERLIAKLVQGGFSLNDVISSLKQSDFDLRRSAVFLTNSLFKTKPATGHSNIPHSLTEWVEEKNSLKVIYESKIKENDPPKDDLYEILLDVEGLKPKFLSLKVFRSDNYPYDMCGMFIVVNDTSYSLPNYIKLSIITHLIEYWFEVGASGMPYIYTCVDWLEHNIMRIINNPGQLYIPPDELGKLKHIKDQANTDSNTKLSVAKRLIKGKKLDVAKIQDHYLSRIESPEFGKSVTNRSKLPAWKKKDDIIDIINQNRVCLITGETGSGKSTQIVQFILDDLNKKNDYHTTMICTQPRRISAIALADRISEERTDKCGQETGYIIRGENKTTDETRISFVTTGVMLRMIQSIFGKEKKLQDSFFQNLGYIFIDEVHERSIDGDFLLIILKQMIKNFPKLKIVLMSATIDKSIFKGYFGHVSSNEIAHVHIEGRTFPIEDFYLDDVLTITNFRISRGRGNSRYDQEYDETESDMLTPSADSKYFQQGNINYELIAELVYRINEDLNSRNDHGSVLIFLPGAMEIKKCLNNIDDKDFWKLPLHSALSSQEQKKIFQNPPYGKRKIIAATNIAETSITIPDAVAVIDTGRVKSVQYDIKSNNTKLVEIWASRAETKQRRGRAGRIRNGLCYKLFTRGTENRMIPQPIPEIKRTKLESVYLVVKAIGVKNVYEFLQNGLDVPDKNNVENAKRVLMDIGALHANNDELTSLGRYLSMLPTDLKSGKLLIYGCIFGCLENALTLAAIGVTGSPFTCKHEERLEMKEIQQKFGKDNGDLIAILNAYKEFKLWPSMKERRKFCGENFLSILRMNDIDSTRLQYLNNLKEIGFIPFAYDSSKGKSNDDYLKFNRNNENMNIIKSILTASLYPQIAMVELPDVKYAQSIGGAIALDPEFKKIKYWTKNDYYRKLLDNGELEKFETESNEKVYPATRIFMHPSSSLFINDEKSRVNPSFIVYNDSQETSKLYAHGITPSSKISVLLFGGSISYDLTSFSSSVKSKGIILDNWLPIRTWCKNAVLVGKLRLLLDKTIRARLENPRSNTGQDVLKVIEELIKISV